MPRAKTKTKRPSKLITRLHGYAKLIGYNTDNLHNLPKRSGGYTRPGSNR